MKSYTSCIPSHERYILYLTHCAEQQRESLPYDSWFRQQPEYMQRLRALKQAALKRLKTALLDAEE